MQFSTTQLDGVLEITHEPFDDFRGKYVEIYNEQIFREHGCDQKFIQDDISMSTKNVLRGVHGDSETWKLVTCLHGKFYLVVVNNDESSPQYRRSQGFTLSDANHKQILIPPKFGNGHIVVSEEAIFHYKQTTYYNPSGQFTIKWDDPHYSMWWPVKNPILSQRDELGRFVD
ncbi:dTDP-4-dehydrorhamnose 3,5-epimerase [SAR116 cluster bacterium]|nr:dTDP-4-dehydrorhamnose 3,5-epimerase [SAR116 cluster bacterium]